MDVRRREDGQRDRLPSSLARGIIGQKVQKQGEEPSRAVEALCQGKDFVWLLQSWRRRAQEEEEGGEEGGEGEKKEAIGKEVGSTREGGEERAAEMEGV